MATNAERQRAYRERKAQKAQKDQQTVPVTEPTATPEQEDELVVEIKGEEKPKPTLAERLGFGKKPAKSLVAKSSPKRATKSNLMTTMLPVLLSSLIVTYAKDRLPVEYQACAPTQEEAGAILAPLMSIIGRRVSVVAKASQDTVDIANAIICSMAYSIRAYVTYVQIKKSKESEHAGTPETVTYQNPIIRPDAIVSAGSQGQSLRYDDDSFNANHAAGDTTTRDLEAALVADLLRRDKQGRDQRGLV